MISLTYELFPSTQKIFPISFCYLSLILSWSENMVLIFFCVLFYGSAYVLLLTVPRDMYTRMFILIQLVIVFSQVQLVPSVVQIFCIFIYFLYTFCEEVLKSAAIIVDVSFSCQFCQYLLHIFQNFFIGCVNIQDYFVFLIN